MRAADRPVPAADRFDGRVDDYARHRPAYPKEAVDFVLASLAAGAPVGVVADVGSGTGIFSAQLLAAEGAPERVVGVEPNAGMRRRSREMLAGETRFEVRDGTAEHTGLPDASVDGVTVAQAFHWFDAGATLNEFRRILRPGGRVVVLWNVRDEEGDELHRGFEEFLRTWGPGYLEVRRTWSVRHRMEEFFRRGYRRATFTTVQRLTAEGLRGRFLSSSYAPAADDPLRPGALRALDELFERSAQDGTVELRYLTECHAGDP